MGSEGGPMLSSYDKAEAKTPASPLNALKLSNIPSPIKRNREHNQARKDEQTPKIIHNGISNGEDEQEERDGKLITTERKNPDDFGFDLVLDDDLVLNQYETANKGHNKEKIKKAGELALVFLDTRKTLMADQNIIDPINNASDFDKNGYIRKQEDGQPENAHKITRSTMVRAEKVKYMIGLKYIYVQKSYDWLVTNAETNMHPGVEGVYNPLQVIRNRKIRAKYHEYPKLLTVKTLPLASNVFSSKNKHRDSKRQWKMIWAVELNELISDLSWRQLHWNELKKPNGELWFPTSTNASIYTSKLGDSKHRGHKLYDKLFADTEDETNKDNSGKDSNNIVTKISTESYNDSRQHDAKRSSHHKTHKIKEKIKKHSKGFYYSSPSSSQSSSFARDASQDASQVTQVDRQFGKFRDSLGSGLKHSRGDSLLTDSNQSGVENENEINEEQPKWNERYTKQFVTPSIKVDGNYAGNDLNILSLQIKPIEHKRNNSHDRASQMDQYKNEKKQDIEEIENVEEVDDLYDSEQEHASQEIISINFDLIYFNTAQIIKLSYLKNIHPAILTSIHKKLDFIINKQLSEITQLSVKIDENYISSHEMFYSGFLNEIKSLTHLINDDYSIKIDNLLSNSDRSIGEINTSLSLELRKANEKLDKLNSSLFGNIVTNTFKDKDISMSITDSGNYKMLYLLLENFIVILLRIIWVIANIYRFFRLIVQIAWKIIWHIFSIFKSTT